MQSMTGMTTRLGTNRTDRAVSALRLVLPLFTQDPLNLSGKNLADFDHVKKDLAVESAEERAAREVCAS